MHFVTLLSHGKCLNSKTMGRLARPPLAYWRATSMSHGLADSVTVSDLYKLRVSRSETRYDESQYRVVKHLDKLQTVIESLSAGAGLDRKQPRGVYLCGSVGIGKTMMMDLFFEGCRVDKKRRVHFHHFMLEIHKRVHEHKKALIDKFGRDRHINLSSERDAIAFVAAQVSAESRLLCFDEFHVTDIADAMIMTKLFGELWRHGTVLVATSNRHPDDLYENGLNRSYFLPFIDLLKNQCTTIALSTSKDYRLEAVKADGAYFLPLNESSKKKLHDACLLSASAVGSAKLELVNVPVMMGRQVQVQAAGRSCLVTFASLCEGDRGPADYHAICSQFDRVYLDGVRQLSLKEHNVVRRLIMLIDVCYDSRVQLVWSGEVEPQYLFTDLFLQGVSALKVLVESDDLSPVDAKEEARLSAAGKEKNVTHIYHHLPSPTADKVQFPPPRNETADAFVVMKGETAAFKDLEFAVQRATSRLIEMSGQDYMNSNRK